MVLSLCSMIQTRSSSIHVTWVKTTGSEMASEELDRFGANGIALSNAHQVETDSDLAAMLDANLGIAIVPASALKSSRFARLNLPGFDLRRTVAIYAVAGRRRSPQTLIVVLCMT